MFSQDVQITFSLAVREAQRRRHEYLTVEHVLYALLFEENGQQIIRKCGADLAVLKAALVTYFDEHLQSLPDLRDEVPEQTVSLQRILQRTVMHVQSSGKETASVGDILAALLAEEKTFAVLLLEEHGVSRYDVVNILSHGLEPDAQEAVPAADPKRGRAILRWSRILLSSTPSICSIRQRVAVSTLLWDDLKSWGERYRFFVDAVKTTRFS